MRAIDADRLVEIFNNIPDKESTAIFIPKIVEVIEEQPSVQPTRNHIESIDFEKCPYYNPDIMFDGKDEYDAGYCMYKPTRIQAKWVNRTQLLMSASAECSNCHAREAAKVYDTGFGNEYFFSNFCPNCGAKMEGGSM